MITVRPANERGHAHHGWLDSYHTFSFADYYDTRFMGYRSLRVINEDRVSGGMGFETHPHRDFEIISYIVSGALRHRDSMGHEAVMRTGEIQRITAGTGIEHSEYNDSPSEPVHFLQIWITPRQKGLTPDYAQRAFPPGPSSGLLLACSPEWSSEAVRINQDARMYVGRILPKQTLDYTLVVNRHVWIQLIEGDLDVSGISLAAGDGAGIGQEKDLLLKSNSGAHFLLFDLD